MFRAPSHPSRKGTTSITTSTSPLEDGRNLPLIQRGEDNAASTRVAAADKTTYYISRRRVNDSASTGSYDYYQFPTNKHMGHRARSFSVTTRQPHLARVSP